MVINVQYIIIMIIVLVIIIITSIAIYSTFIQKILNEKTKQYQLELDFEKEISLQYIRVQENERKRIAKTLHDEIGNKLNILSIWICNEETWNSSRSREIVTQQIPELIESTRAISHSLYPMNIEEFGLILTIETLISNIHNSLSIELIANLDNQKRPLNFEVEIYRIIQEFLSNVIKHANASKVIIQIRDTDNAFTLILSDNGLGFDNNQVHMGMGLKNIDSRIKSIKAHAKWKSIKEKGTRLIIVHPKS